MSRTSQLHNAGELTTRVKQIAMELGFSEVGICDALPLEKSGNLLDLWLDKGMHGTMTWMAKSRMERRNPKAYFPEAQSVIVLAYNYFQQPEPKDAEVHFARYAVGRDYHKVLKGKLKKLAASIKEIEPNSANRPCVDSFPILEKPLAVKAGLGWQGKNTNLIIKGKGSFFFLSELLTSLKLIPDAPFTSDHCGSCNRCQQACPTNALDEAYVLNGKECIAYLTIERKGPLPNRLASLLSDWVFGCDICQAVCPWNKFSEPTEEQDFTSRITDELYLLEHLRKMTEGDFLKTFEGTPIRRAGYQKFMESVSAIISNKYTDKKEPA